MKNNIGFVSMDAAALRWLTEKLKAAPADVLCAEELLDAISDLENGKIRSLMLESCDNMSASYEPCSGLETDRLVALARKG
ncbi:MAG: hypothetical protein LUI07_03450, partial [Lachnospiraceae bacterium]|nr:hypothetical protein [Lachnospiraceae bacterium]